MTLRPVLLRCAILAAATAAGTLLLGWWVIPLVGAAYGRWPGGFRWRALEAAAGAALAWTALLSWTALQGPAVELSAKVGAVFGLPGPGLLAVTVLFAVLLAGTAAAFTTNLRA